MRQRNVEEKHKTGRKTFESWSCKSGLLLSIVCCIALIHVELRVQEHHRLISHSVALCGQMETQILRAQQKNGRYDGKSPKAALQIWGKKQRVSTENFKSGNS